MSATLLRGQTFGSTETITNTKLHNLVDLATISGIVNAEIAAAAQIAYSKLDLTNAILTNDLKNAQVTVAKMAFDALISNTSQPRCKVYLNNDFTISGGGTDEIDWEAEDFDVGECVDLGTYPTRLTVPTGGDGVYLIVSNLRATPASIGGAFYVVLKNGGTIARQYFLTSINDIVGGVVHISRMDLCEAVAGDYFEARATKVEGDDLVIAKDIDYSSFGFIKLW